MGHEAGVRTRVAAKSAKWLLCFTGRLGREPRSTNVCNKDSLIFLYCLGDLSDIIYDLKDDKS